MWKLITVLAGILAIAIAVQACSLVDKGKRLNYANSLFSGKEQYENFARIPDMFPVSMLERAQDPMLFPIGGPYELPSEFRHEGQAQSTKTFLEETDTVALLILHDGRLRFENYWLTGGEDVVWPSWSVAKSYVSALVGIAIEDGLIEFVEDPIDQYLPELASSGYADVSIKDVLQMSSGARWNEDYSAFDSDINRLGRILALGGSLDKFVASIGPDLPSGTYNRYNSADTQVLGQLIVAVTGQSLSDYMSKRLWQPIGAEGPGHWLLDSRDMEMAFAGFHATARDYAKLGELYRNRGMWRGRQLVPEDWVSASLKADAAHLQPGDNPASNNEFGYGYQWWLLDGDEGEFTAMGVYNQFVYVRPAKGVVIVKLSAKSDFGISNDQSSYRDQETISLFRTLAALEAPEGT